MTARAAGLSLSIMPFRLLPLAATLAVGALLAPSAALARESHQSPVRDALDRVVAAGAPGAVALADRHAAAAGVADLRTRRPLHAGDRLRIGSVTKTFTATVALQLVDEGRLRLTDTVGGLLPGVLPAADGVTLRQLLNHTSGVPDDLRPFMMEVFRGDPLRVWTPDAQLAPIAGKPLRFAPGKGWSYSNPDYVLVAMMIERATGHSLGHELDHRIVRPLGLRHTSFPVADPDLGPHAARGYSLELGPNGPVLGPLHDITRYSPSFAWGAGNGVSTVRDVARFYRALLNGRLLTPQMLREALTPVETNRPGRRYGLGLNLYDTRYGTLVGHDGDVPGFSIKVLSTVDGREQAVVAINAMFVPPRVDDALDEAMDAVADAAFAPRRRG